MKPKDLGKLLPLLLTACIVLVDQLTKAIVAAELEVYRPVSVLGDFLRLTYKRNMAMAFSIGRGLPEEAQRIVFLVAPALVIIFLVLYYIGTTELTRGQRWLLAGILGGGLGNYVDRIVRSDGVVDFIDVKFYGIFGLERWPTFNVADASVVVAGILLLVSMIVVEARSNK